MPEPVMTVFTDYTPGRKVAAIRVEAVDGEWKAVESVEASNDDELLRRRIQEARAHLLAKWRADGRG